MPSIDFATTQIFIDDNFIDVSFEFAHEEVKNLVKQSYRAIFVKDRKCWRINRSFSKADPDVVVKEIEAVLYDHAPEVWKPFSDKHKDFHCATKRYDIKVGPGGIRLIFPAGHAAHYKLKKSMGHDTKLSTWYLPAKIIDPKEIMPLVARANQEDRQIVEDALEPYERRTLRGVLNMTPQEADESNVQVGNICFADFPFVSRIEPHVADQHLYYWPFKVLEREDKPVPTDENPEAIEMTARLMYMPPASGCNAIRKYMSMPIDARPWPLDLTRPSGKWRSKTLESWPG
jgi:hypothetical protein